MPELLTFFIILAAGLFFSELFNRLHLPWVVALLVAGIVIGPFGVDLFTPDRTMEFLAQVGLVFLMFMAGLEVRLSSLKKLGRGVFRISLLNGLVPFTIGVMITRWFDYDWPAALLVGAVFMASSIAVVIPSFEVNGMLKTRLGKSIVSATMFEDIVGLVILSVLLQATQPITTIPLPVFYLLLLAALIALRWILPRLREYFHDVTRRQEIFQRELRFTITMLIGIVVLFELLGLHPLVAGFFAGLVLSESLETAELKQKLHALSYGIFIPIFFIVVGAQTDIWALFNIQQVGLLAVLIVSGYIVSKLVTGFLGAWWAGFSWQDSALAGASTMPQLSTALAVAFTATSLGIIDQSLAVTLVLLTLVTTLIGPMIVTAFASRMRVK